MKRITVFILTIVLLGLLFGCGKSSEKEEEPTTFEIAMIADIDKVEMDPFGNTTWKGIQDFCVENEKTCKYYSAQVADGASDKEIQEASAKAVERAKSEGAKVIIFAGSQFETSVHALQTKEKDLRFILIDGVPRDAEHNYQLAANSTGVLFAEEEAGFLAGYAAVADGYTRLGFLGGKELPSVKRYGYGFLQGASAAAKEMKKPEIEIKYEYTDTFRAEDWIREGALSWYKSGTELIFACGGSIGESVIEAADYSGGKVIGVDTDQSGLSESVITSAEKEIKTAIYDILKTYIHNTFKGNSIFTYSLKNKGISLEMTNARFREFNSAGYDDLVRRIDSGELKIQKEMGNKDLEDLAQSPVKVTREKISTSDSQD